ncbi:MAG: hypothetical protein ACXVXS_12010 [Blastococcus sp.]
MFRDSRGVVHTVSSADPLDDLPVAAASALARTLLVPVGGDLGGALERCEAVRELLDRWQDAFFAALPSEVDLDEEARWAAEAGLSLEEIEAQWEDDDTGDDPEEDDGDWGDDEEAPGLDLPFAGDGPHLLDLPAGRTGALDDEQAAELEVALVLLPVRVRLEALVAAAALVDEWADLLADHEKCLGHLVLRHGLATAALPHEELADRHAALHAGTPGHSSSADERR